MNATFDRNKALFDSIAFGQSISNRLARLKLSYRALEHILGVDHNAIYRAVQGKSVSIESYLRLKLWLEQN